MRLIDKNHLIKWLLLLTLLLIVLNLCAYYAISIILGVSMYDSSAYEEQKKILVKPEKDFTFVHPYIGKMSVSNQALDSDLSSEPLFESVSRSPNRENEIKILILGGSVALDLSQHQQAQEANIFSKTLNHYFGTDRFSVFNAAFAGGKQPQQYLKLVYFDLLGFEPDIVINYDGFNEIALPFAENLEIKNPPIYPRLYSRHMVSSVSSRKCVPLNNRILSFNSNVPIIELVGWLFVKYCHNEVLGSSSPPWWAEKVNAVSESELLKQTLSIWRESSNRLYRFTKEKGIDYIHVLQPNQYYKNSKIFSAEEKLNAFGVPLYGVPIEKYYGLLRGEDISAENFKDHRLLFSNISETLYRDSCCHLNVKGTQLIAEDMVVSFSDVFARYLE